MLRLKLALGAALFALLIGCSHSGDDPHSSANPSSTSPPASPSTTTSHESPAATAEAAAAAAPECKAIEQAKPGSCQPAANGVPKK
jgi:hypothetical protein